MSEEGPSQKKRALKKGSIEEDTPVQSEEDIDNENIDKDKMDGNKRSSPRRKYIKEVGSGVPEKIDKKGKNKGDDDSSEEAEVGDDVKSKQSKSEDEEYVSEPPAKRRRLVRSAQENVSAEENPESKTSKPAKKKGAKRAAKRITQKKSKSNKKAKIKQDEGVFEVEKIVKAKILKNGKREFLIRWKGFTAEHDTWEPERNVTCKELITLYLQDHSEEIETPAEEEKRTKKSKSKRRGSSKTKKADSTADEGESAKGNAKKGKGKSKQSQSKGKKRQTRAHSTGAKSGKDDAAVTDSEKDSDEKTKTEKDEGEDTSQSAGASEEAQETGEHSGIPRSGDQKEYEVEKILDVRQTKEGDREFLIKWRGYPDKYNTWEAEKNMNCSDEIENFLKSVEQNPTGRELRVVRKKTSRFVADGGRGRKKSLRLGMMPKKSYTEVE